MLPRRPRSRRPRTGIRRMMRDAIMIFIPHPDRQDRPRTRDNFTQDEMKLSILVPLYNEEEFVGILLERVIAAPLPEGVEREIIVADDASTDGSVEQVESVAARFPGMIRLLRTDCNQGGGSHPSEHRRKTRGDLTITFRTPTPVRSRRSMASSSHPDRRTRRRQSSDRVFSSPASKRVLYFWHSLANHVLTGMCNIVSRSEPDGYGDLL